MTPDSLLTAIAAVVVLGVGAQWLAWRFRLPSILLLLVCGFVAGPVTGFINPQTLQGDWLFPFVSLSVGIILFEGGLSLRLNELKDVGLVVRNLITIGVVFTGIVAAVGAHYLVGFGWPVSVVMGAILTVTGPTVIIPLLRHVRPSGRVGTIAKWEGITIDPIGAILAVLVLEAVILIYEPSSSGHVAEGFGAVAMPLFEGLLLEIVVGLGASVAGAFILIVLIRRRLLPDWLQNPFALMTVVAVFALSNALQEESGLLSTTLMGIFMANQRYVSVHKIVEFKEDLQVLLISFLFIILSARLELSALAYITVGSVVFLGLLILIVRPLAVMLSARGTKLTWKEQAFLGWLAPRGIVAAAVASLFSFRLADYFPEDAAGMVPVVFLVIVGTVAIYGLTISPVARWLGLAQPNPQGVLILGAHAWAQHIAAALNDLGFKVQLIDSNIENIEQTRNKGLNASMANALSESIIDDLDLSGIGRFLALTPNDEVNSLAALHFTEVFESTSVYQLAAQPESRSKRADDLAQHLRGRPLFGQGATFATLSNLFNSGGEVATSELKGALTYEALRARHGDEVVLLFIARNGDLLVHAEEGQLVPQEGDKVVVFLPQRITVQTRLDEAAFEKLVARALVFDLAEKQPFDDIAAEAAALVALRLPITADRLAHGFIDGIRYGAVPITQGIALPHFRVPGLVAPELLMVRCPPGIVIERAQDNEEPDDPVKAIFFLVSPEENPGQHLRTLANLANRIVMKNFMDRWLSAKNEQQLKETLLDSERYVSLMLQVDDESKAFIGRTIANLDLPASSTVVMVRRNGKVFEPDSHIVLNVGDRLTITGEVSDMKQVRSAYAASV